MQSNKEDFMQERIRAEMSTEDYFNLSAEQRASIDIKTIDVPEFDYSGDEIWQGLKKKSTKAYKDLKKREFEIRNDIKK
jgi:hypothetical protein